MRNKNMNKNFEDQFAMWFGYVVSGVLALFGSILQGLMFMAIPVLIIQFFVYGAGLTLGAYFSTLAVVGGGIGIIFWIIAVVMMIKNS